MFAEKLAPIKTQSKTKTDHGIIIEQGENTGERIEFGLNELLIFLVIIRVINSFHVHFTIVDFIG
jgi:hypothetical protein